MRAKRTTHSIDHNFVWHIRHNNQGLDPARPLIEQLANSGYRLTRDDADVVQIIHTNAGTLGQKSFSGSLDLCINGGSLQPFCRRGLRLSKQNKKKKNCPAIFCQ